MLKVGVIGYGYWGPNVVRNFHNFEQSYVTHIAELDPKARAQAGRAHHTVQVVSDCREVIRSPEVDVVAIVTPVSTHYELAKEALLNGKHVFIEKPFTATSQQAMELIELADARQLQIMVDHTFLFTGAVRKIKEIIDTHQLGEIYYYDSTRVNLGLFQSDVNVIWDLAPHDFSILDYLIEEKPVAISAHGMDYFGTGLASVAYVTLYFKTPMIAHFNFNWLSPVKVRETLIGGAKQMVVWNDVEADEKLKVYDKGIRVDSKEGLYNVLVEYRTGDMYSPKLDRTEALTRECQYFAQCIQTGQRPFNDGAAGLRMVQLLEAADLSLKQRGEIVEL